jgi:hypothetical protein
MLAELYESVPHQVAWLWNLLPERGRKALLRLLVKLPENWQFPVFGNGRKFILTIQKAQLTSGAGGEFPHGQFGFLRFAHLKVLF